MAVVAQLVERWVVVPVAAGSNPVDRPIQITKSNKNNIKHLGL